MIFRTFIYFSKGLVMLFTHSNIFSCCISWYDTIVLVFLIFFIISPISPCCSSHSVVFSSHPFLWDYVHLFPRSHVFLYLSEDIIQFSKNVCWLPCRRSFSEECFSSGLLCNCFSCFQWQFFFFWLLIFEWKGKKTPPKTVSDSPTDRVCRFYLVLLIGHLGNDGIFSDL